MTVLAPPTSPPREGRVTDNQCPQLRPTPGEGQHDQLGSPVTNSPSELPRRPPLVPMPPYVRGGGLPINSNLEGACSSLTLSRSVLYNNVRSLLPKIVELQLVYLSENPEIVCIVETWLNETILDLKYPLMALLLKGWRETDMGVLLSCMSKIVELVL